MRIKLIAASLLVAATATASSTETRSDRIRKSVEAFLGDNVKVESISKTPYSGLYEVTVDGNVLYTDESGKYMFFGHVWDAASKKDFTKDRVEDLNKIKFADLPFDQSVKMVNGQGQRVIAVFEDPNCGYCKRFRQTLQQVDNLTVYTFMYNILAPSSREISRNVWCSGDRAKAWDEWMVGNKPPSAAPAECQAPNDQIFELGQKLKITGTPTIFFADGTRIPGAVDAKGLEEKLSSLK